jgi:HK97 family phage major capsid protein
MEIGYRTFKVERAEDDEYPKGILTTEQPVAMYDWQRADYIPEVLLMSGMKARGKTIKLLDTHKTDSVSNVLGSFSNLERKQAGDREVPYNFVEGRIEVSSVHPEIKTKLDEGHINEMSVGYKYTEDKTVFIPKGKSKEINGQKFEGPVNIRTEWHAEEASLVPLGADSQAQIRGYKDFKEAQQKISRQLGESESELEDVTIQKAETHDKVSTEEKPNGEKTQTITTETQQKNDMENIEKNDGVEEQVNAAVKATKDAFDKRADAILALGEEVGDSNWALSQLRSDRSVEQVQREAIQKIKEDSKSLGSLSQPEPLGLNEKESKSYSITNAMKSLVNGGTVDGLEKEVSDAIAKRSGRETHGFFLASQRDLVAGTATDGAELVPTDTRGGDFIDALRPNMVTMQAGVRVLNGLKGDVSIPRKSSVSEATFKAEVTAHSNTEPQFESVTLTPRHLGTYTDVSKQLLAQGSPDVDALIRDDLNKAIAVGLDKAVIQGAGNGSNAPQGVIGATGVSAITIADNSGGEPTTAELHTFLKELDDDNALRDNCTWITTPTIAAAAKQTLLTSAVSGYQWDMSNNTILGYPAFSTANIPDERTILGDFSEYILGIYDGIEIVYDPFSGAKTRTVTFVLNLMCDGDVRQPKAFAVSDDGS